MMDGVIELLSEQLRSFGAGPTLDEMSRRTLSDKMINGATAGHFIEEVQTPLNFAYLTCTTGTSAIQNVVGVTHSEMPERTAAGLRVLEHLGIREGSRVLITYPPLVSVFGSDVFRESGVRILFMLRPSRDAFLVSLCGDRPDSVIGESSFLRASLQEAEKLGLQGHLPKNLKLIAAGTPMDPELRETAEKLEHAEVHDLYGCQEFGWLCLDGVPLREDITFWDEGAPAGYSQAVVGGLATGDCFRTKAMGGGKRIICTETRLRAEETAETIIEETRAESPVTVRSAARSVLRIKARIVRVSPEIRCSSAVTKVRLRQPGTEGELVLYGPEKTRLLDDLIEAQKTYQRESRVNPVWNKQRKMNM